ncbi:MAG: signal recognition particle protein [Gammaproteobacteria bacterium]|nr:signal recognition particle protein [Gammaproteobacteria bacterium]
MFGNLSDRLQSTFKNLSGQGRITETNIQATVREVRMALLEADVALPVVKQFTEQVRERALGAEVLSALSPAQAFIKVVNDALVDIMGGERREINLRAAPPVVILMAGLQGAGKTTTVGKLGRFLTGQHKKKVMVVSADVYRPAAIDQLETVATQAGLTFFPSNTSQKPVDIAKAAIAEAKRKLMDVVIVDTAGRLAIDDAMMDEIKALHAAINPTETLFVVDAMTGQDAANTAKAFSEALPLTGVVLSKADGDSRGGAALSVRMITGAPILFAGMGEKLDALEVFHPDRMASRILGMGDVVSLVEQVTRDVDMAKAEKLAKKVKKGKKFDLEDLRDQMLQMQSLGGVGSLMGKLPGMGQMAGQVDSAKGDKEVNRMVAIINSMTPQERKFPDIIKASRKKRIAKGSGVEIQDVNRLLKQHQQMAKMMKKMAGGGMAKMMQMMKGGMAGGMPPGMPPFR